MARNKWKQILEVKDFDNVFSEWDRDFDPQSLRGNWHEKYFQNQNPITLELGCGHGQYTLALAQADPGRNFIGIDKKGDRIWVGAKEALNSEKATGTESKFTSQSLRSVAFIQMYIDNLANWFAPEEVDEIWITFPDPQPKPSKANKRLTSPKFLDIYRKITKPGATIHLKTDNADLFEYSVEVAKEHGEIQDIMRNIHQSPNNIISSHPSLQILTFYEKKFMAQDMPINYLSFKL